MDGTQEEGGTGSSIDLEFDQSNALWVLFQRPSLPDADSPPSFDFSALKLAQGSLKELGQWNLRGLNPEKWANAFVACGILYKVELANTNNNGEGIFGKNGKKLLEIFEQNKIGK